MSFSWIDNDRDLKALLDGLKTETRVALDTEFHREKTYFPRLALVQLAWSDGLAIVDPLSCDARMLSQIFGPDHLIVLHAAQQDLDVLSHAIGKTVVGGPCGVRLMGLLLLIATQYLSQQQRHTLE